jgi:alpha-methylacyl-CoA racemase
MFLADLGADVVLLERPGGRQIGVPAGPEFDLTNRGKRIVRVDLKSAAGAAQALDLVSRADVLLEGFRPGTMERLGLGPDNAQSRNPRLVYTRITGWGQTGPRSPTAGHDIDYIAVAGALGTIGRADTGPIFPVNLLGDYAGGTMFALVGILAALFESRRSGQGQVVDAAMVDGTAALLTPMFGLLAAGVWKNQRGVNILDSGAPFYDVYRTKDGKYLAVGALEDPFFAQFADRIGLGSDAVVRRRNPAQWPALKAEIARVIAEATRDEWVTRFEGSDGCVAPVLDLREATRDPHNVARGVFVTDERGLVHPAPAPRFARTPARTPSAPPVDPVTIESVQAGWAASASTR